MSEKILYRDSLNTPWGFRMTGGKDLKQSLSIQQVKPGSPCHGELEVGDVLVEIQRNEAANLTHKQAQDLIRSSGGSLKLRIIRQGFSQPRNNLNTSTNPKGHFLLQKLHDSLTDAVIGRGPSSPRTYNLNYPLTPDFYNYPEAQKSSSWGIIEMKPKAATPRKQPEFGWMPEALKHRTLRYVDEHPTQKMADNYSRIRQVSSPPQMADAFSNSNILHDFNHNLQSLPNNGFYNFPRNVFARDVKSRDVMSHDEKSHEETISEIATHRPTHNEFIKISDF